ncbi:Kae1-associated kinase Bud32 [Candidatus Micrarchaeota archaeon CG1_02_47_40]|nr:MAG: Kae1-associated kinase Bud32 [Candidatus Micrarchaeota archaeon CG1_02_47_40]
MEKSEGDFSRLALESKQMEELRGAEAVLKGKKVDGEKALCKIRGKKGYRNALLDAKLRKGRTKREAKLMQKASEAGVPCPAVFGVREFEIDFSFIEGRLASEMRLDGNALKESARLLSLLHSINIIHGDYTPANLIIGKGGRVSVIDFGLGFFSHKLEDKAVDVFTMKQALEGGMGKKFVEEYEKFGEKGVVERMREVESRARYRERKEK